MISGQIQIVAIPFLALFLVNPEGLPRAVAVFHSLTPEFDKAPVNAVKQWKFSPATQEGYLGGGKTS